MNDYPKIQLSAFEEQLVTDSGWLLTKNAILEKIRRLLLAVQDDQQSVLSDNQIFLPAETLKIPAKITRGENYLGLPWLVLDQPRLFDKENTFAIRTMFWWGQFFSTTLQISGRYKDLLLPKIAGSFEMLRNNDFQISQSDSPWHHHFGEDNYKPLHEMEKDEFDGFLKTHPFIKLAKKTPLETWETIDQKLLKDYRTLISTLGKPSKNREFPD